MKLVLTEDKTKIILKESSHEEYHQLKLHLIRKVDNFFFKKRHKLGVWDGSIDHFKNGIIRYGLWKEIYKCCKEHGYKFDIDKTSFPFDFDVTRESVVDFCKEYYKDYRIDPNEQNPEGLFTPYDHQIDAVFNMLKYKYGLIEVATAGGKSLIFATFMFYILKNINPNAKFLLVVPQMSLVTQFYDDIVDYNLGYNKEQKNPFILNVEEIFSDKPRKVRDGIVPNVYISTYQSLINYPIEFMQQFDVVITDECLHPDTYIELGNGDQKMIKNIVKGDEVWTFNENTKEKEIKEVEYVYHNLSQNENMYEIELENNETIFITGNHKVLLKNGEWKRVDNLLENDDILDFNI